MSRAQLPEESIACAGVQEDQTAVVWLPIWIQKALEWKVSKQTWAVF
jgi:hypothetical protein